MSGHQLLLYSPTPTTARVVWIPQISVDSYFVFDFIRSVRWRRAGLCYCTVQVCNAKLQHSTEVCISLLKVARPHAHQFAASLSRQTPARRHLQEKEHSQFALQVECPIAGERKRPWRPSSTVGQALFLYRGRMRCCIVKNVLLQGRDWWWGDRWWCCGESLVETFD